MLHTKFQGHRSIGSGDEDFFNVYHICVWGPYWSCDHTQFYKLSFPFSHKLSYELWYQIIQLFLRKKSLNLKAELSLTKVKE